MISALTYIRYSAWVIWTLRLALAVVARSMVEEMMVDVDRIGTAERRAARRSGRRRFKCGDVRASPADPTFTTDVT